jgi:hypothetical protein
VDGVFTRKPYVLTITGTGAGDVVCSCPAGQKGTACKHLAVALFCRKHHVYAVKPVETSDPLAEVFA